MMDPIVFDQVALTEWVQACQAEAAMREQGAPPEQLAAARTGAIAGLVSLIAPSVEPDVVAALFALMLQDNAFDAPVQEQGQEEEEQDPIPESASQPIDTHSVTDDIIVISDEENAD